MTTDSAAGSRAAVREGGRQRARGGRCRPRVRAGREEARAARRRRRCASCSGATSSRGYDAWFDGSTRRSGARGTATEVIVDHMATTEINARGAAEAAARKGHDLFLFISPPAAYENQVIDHKEIVDEVEKRHGKMIPLAREVDAQSENRQVLRVLRLLRPGSRQLPHRSLERGRLSERARARWEDLRDGRPEDQGEVRQPGRPRSLAGDRLEHGAARPALVVRRRRAGRRAAASSWTRRRRSRRSSSCGRSTRRR